MILRSTEFDSRPRIMRTVEENEATIFERNAEKLLSTFQLEDGG